MDATDWKTLLQPGSRQSMVTNIYLPITGPERLVELDKIAVRFEEKIFTAATRQSEYLRRISLKLQTMETESQMNHALKKQKSQTNAVFSSLPFNTAGGSQNSLDPASYGMQSQVCSIGQSQVSLANQSLAQQQLLSQNIQNNITNPGIQGHISWSQIRTNDSNIEPNMDATDWKTLLQPAHRQSIVPKLVVFIFGMLV
ncbi:hypothetical protein MKX01_020354, partial [Papaver californicum]